jgi:hypothetical protein
MTKIITYYRMPWVHNEYQQRIRYCDIVRRANAEPEDIRYVMRVARNYQNAISKQKKQNFKQKYEKISSLKKELLNKSRNPVSAVKAGNTVSTSNTASAGRKIPFTMIIGGTALAVIIGLVVKKIRNAIKKNAELKKNAQQNDTDPRYIEFVENQMRTGQYNEPAIVNSVKAQIVPILEKDVMSKYNSGAITDQEYRDSKIKIENIKRANTLEDVYAEIKMPEIKREIVAYRTAKSKIERELAVLQQFAVRNQMSPFHDAGVKGMKKGQHVKARDPEYLKRLKAGLGLMGGGAALMGAGILMRRKAGKLAQAASGAAKSVGGAAANATNAVKNAASAVQKVTSPVTNTANAVTKAVAKTNIGNTLSRGNKLVKKGSIKKGHAIKAKSISRAGVVPNISSKNVLKSTAATKRALRTKGYSWSV